MKKIISTIVFALALCGISVVSYASEIEKDISVNAKTQYDITDVVEGVRVDTDEIKVELEDGTVIRATGEFEDTIRLMVMPITKSMTKEWNWLQSVTKKIGENKSCYDIFFINSSGKRVDGGEGSEISVMTNSKIKNLVVYYIEASGQEKKLDSTVEEYAVKFKMMKNGYYTLLSKSIPKKQSSSKPTKKPSNKKTNTSKNDKDVDDDEDEKDRDEDKEDIKDEEEIIEDEDIIDNEDDITDDGDDKTLDDMHDHNDDDEEDVDDDGKRPDGSGTGKEDKDNGLGDIITLLSIVFVFIATGIIFLIILKKKKKEKEDEE